MPKKILITGGVKSGKSRHALELAKQIKGKKLYLATAESLDQEMHARISAHQKERGRDFKTVEEPVHLSRCIKELETKNPSVIVIDCVTLWLNNLFFYCGKSPKKIQDEQDRFLKALGTTKTDLILITNEIGLGIIPDRTLNRNFMEQLGMLNYKIADTCDEVIFMVSGIPLKLK